MNTSTGLPEAAASRAYTSIAAIENDLIRRDLFAEAVSHAITSLNFVIRYAHRDDPCQQTDQAAIRAWKEAGEAFRLAKPFIDRLEKERREGDDAAAWRAARMSVAGRT